MESCGSHASGPLAGLPRAQGVRTAPLSCPTKMPSSMAWARVYRERISASSKSIADILVLSASASLCTLVLNCDRSRIGRLVWITSVAGILVGFSVLHAKRLVCVLVAELEFTPPTELALLCIEEDFTGRECAVPRDLCDVVTEGSFCLNHRSRPRRLRDPTLGPDVECHNAVIQVVRKDTNVPADAGNLDRGALVLAAERYP